MVKQRLLLVGPYPIPYGGVSTHIERLSELLKDDFAVSFIDESKTRKSNVFNIRSINFFSYLSIIKNCDIIHAHSGHYLLRLLHFVVSRLLKKKIVFTIHSYTLDSKSTFEKYVDQLIFRRSHRIVCVSEKISEVFNFSNAHTKEAFLPPILEKEPVLPTQLTEWINCKRNDGYFLCCANASRLDSYKNEDLYGLDLCIETARRCKKENIKLAFIFIVSSSGGSIPITKYEKLIQELDMEETFFIHKYSLSFVNLINESDVVLRPTNTDGDALTIREGLFLGKIVLASDVVERPKKTLLFMNRNVDSLFGQIKLVYKRLTADNKESNCRSNNLDVNEYLSFYKDLLYQ